MAPTSPNLFARYYCNNYDQFGNCYGSNSRWDIWGRWVALVVIIFIVLLLAFAFSCLNARRRRNRGMAPRYGTGWLGGNKFNGQNGPGYYNNGQGQPQFENPAPAYSPPANQYQNTGNTFNSNEGYYGQQSGVELQQPQHAYQPQHGGQNVYQPPQGPPPGKGAYGNDGIVR